MKNNILMLPVGSKALSVREIDDPDLMVNLVERHPGHIQRRKDRQDARRRRLIREREDREQQLRDLTLVGQFSALGVLVTLGLML